LQAVKHSLEWESPSVVFTLNEQDGGTVSLIFSAGKFGKTLPKKLVVIDIWH